MKTTPKKTKTTIITAPGVEVKAKVAMPPSFTARVNQFAHRKGKAVADLWRTTTMMALQELADQGAPLEELSLALAGIERDPVQEQTAEVAAAMSQLKGE